MGQHRLPTYQELQDEMTRVRADAEERTLERVMFNVSGAALWFLGGVMFAAAVVGLFVAAVF
jgi:hypothetical protein